MIRTYLMTLSFIGGRGVGGYTQLESGFHFFMVAPLMLTALILLTEYLLRCGNEKEGLHGNLWVNQSEIHQNPSSVKRQSGITAPVGRFYSVCRLTAART